MSQPFDSYKLGTCLFEETPVAAPLFQPSSSGGMPERIDLRDHCSPVEDQEDIGSCAANAVVGAMEFHQRRAGHDAVDLSRLFLYYNARKLADNEQNDSGTFIHHAMAAVLAYGVCPESMWPYQRAMWATRPIQPCYDAALDFEAVSYARTPLGPSCKGAIAAGLPVVFGACLPAEMIQQEAGLTGRISVPKGSWPAPGGGHAMLIVGYDDADGTWLIRNSWGTQWGEGGYARVPYAVMERYGMPTQFWVIGQIAGVAQQKGTSLQASQAAVMAAAASQVESAIARSRASLRQKLEGDLAEAKSGFRSRLRGPGAGGGY